MYVSESKREGISASKTPLGIRNGTTNPITLFDEQYNNSKILGERASWLSKSSTGKYIISSG
jgi:hypothetical protein